MSNNTTETKRQAVNDIPEAAIREAAKTYANVWVKVRRHGTSGQIAVVKGNPFFMPTLSLLEIDVWLSKHIGGGRYHCEARLEQDQTMPIQEIPPFYVSVEGAPIVSALPPHVADRPQVLDPSSGVMRDIPRAGVAVSDLISNTPDQIALEQLNQRQKELAAERQLREQERRAADDRFRQQQALIDDMQKRLIETQSNRERDQLRAELDAIKTAMAQRDNGPKLDIVGLAAALAPLGAALITSGRDAAVKQAEAQAKVLEVQQNSTTQMLTALASKPASDPLAGVVGLLGALVPALAPIAKEFMSSRSPDKLAELMGSMADANLSQMSMLNQVLQPFLQQEDNPMVSFLQQGLNSLVEVAQHMSSVVKPPQKQPSQMAAGAGRRSVSAGGAPAARRNGRAAAAASGAGGEAATANYFVNLVLNAPNVSAQLKTPEWQSIYYALHTFAPAADVAKQLATTLAAQVDAGSLPTEFMPIFHQDSTVAPSAILGPFLLQLPAGAIRPDYMQTVLEQFDLLFGPEESDEAEPEDAEIVDEPEAVHT